MATCCEQLDKLGFEVIPIPYDNVVPFGGILHCTTLDIPRTNLDIRAGNH
jgi:glycine amidinotransferase